MFSSYGRACFICCLLFYRELKHAVTAVGFARREVGRRPLGLVRTVWIVLRFEADAGMFRVTVAVFTGI